MTPTLFVFTLIVGVFLIVNFSGNDDGDGDDS